MKSFLFFLFIMGLANLGFAQATGSSAIVDVFKDLGPNVLTVGKYIFIILAIISFIIAAVKLVSSQIGQGITAIVIGLILATMGSITIFVANKINTDLQSEQAQGLFPSE